MNSNQPNEHLRQRISANGKRAFEAKQVASRLRDILPLRLEKIRDHYSGSLGFHKAQRSALTDSRYLDHIGELVEVTHTASKARIEWETHTMLMQARRSLRAFQR